MSMHFELEQGFLVIMPQNTTLLPERIRKHGLNISSTDWDEPVPINETSTEERAGDKETGKARYTTYGEGARIYLDNIYPSILRR